MLKNFKLFSGCNDDDLANAILEEAEKTILTETRRRVMIDPLLSAKRDLALFMYNRLGTVGETSRSEGGISVTYEEMPKSVQRAISSYRLARVCGHAFEKEQTEDSTTEEV